MPNEVKTVVILLSSIKKTSSKEPYFETFSVCGAKGAKVKQAIKEFEMLKFCRMLGGMLNMKFI